jgi:hypothetical protein
LITRWKTSSKPNTTRLKAPITCIMTK